MFPELQQTSSYGNRITLTAGTGMYFEEGFYGGKTI